MNKVTLIGIGGTNGSGKDTIGFMLAEEHGWLFVSASDILRSELLNRNLPIEREHLRNVGAEWRREHGHGVLIDKAVEAHSVTKDSNGLVIASLRNPGEADRIHELEGKVVWVDADPKIRYQRIYSRQRSSEDKKTYKQFLKEEQAEMAHSGDEATLNMAGVKAKADIFLENNGDNIEEFLLHAEKKLSKIVA